MVEQRHTGTSAGVLTRRRRQLVSGVTAIAAVGAILVPGTGSGVSAQSGPDAAIERFVSASAEDLLGRGPTTAERARWSLRLSGGAPRLDVTSDQVASPEWRARVVTGLYGLAFDRAPDAGGLGHWSDSLRSGGSTAAVAGALLGSPERRAAADEDDHRWLSDVYQDVLGRAADQAGHRYWIDRMADGADHQSVARALFKTPEANATRVDRLYRDLLSRPVDRDGRAHWSRWLTTHDDSRLAAVLVASAEYGVRVEAARGDGDDPSTSTTAPGSTTTMPPAHPDPEHFTGTVADFYIVPDPLPFGEPGTLIRYQELGSSGGYAHQRIMYHSRDAEDRDRAVTGTISFPLEAPPPGGWPVVSFSHGTTGIAAQCAPSRNATQAPGYGVHGVRVATDYIGLGPVGEIHPYLSAASEGHAVIDAVRAARQVSGANAGTSWLSIGGSQGGHAALVAGERNDTYAPELTLLGTVAMAPPAAMEQTFGPIDQIVTHIVGVMAIYGMAGEHPSVEPRDYVSDEVAALFPVLEDGCLGEIMDTFLLQVEDHANFWSNDPRETEPARSFFLPHEPGLVPTPAPLLITSGTTDIQVHYERVRILVERLCASGHEVEFHEYQGADHGAVFSLSNARAEEFLAERIAGEGALSSCDDPERPRPEPQP